MHEHDPFDDALDDDAFWEEAGESLDGLTDTHATFPGNTTTYTGKQSNTQHTAVGNGSSTVPLSAYVRGLKDSLQSPHKSQQRARVGNNHGETISDRRNGRTTGTVTHPAETESRSIQTNVVNKSTQNHRIVTKVSSDSVSTMNGVAGVRDINQIQLPQARIGPVKTGANVRGVGGTEHCKQASAVPGMSTTHTNTHGVSGDGRLKTDVSQVVHGTVRSSSGGNTHRDVSESNIHSGSTNTSTSRHSNDPNTNSHHTVNKLGSNATHQHIPSTTSHTALQPHSTYTTNNPIPPRKKVRLSDAEQMKRQNEWVSAVNSDDSPIRFFPGRGPPVVTVASEGDGKAHVPAALVAGRAQLRSSAAVYTKPDVATTPVRKVLKGVLMSGDDPCISPIHTPPAQVDGISVKAPVLADNPDRDNGKENHQLTSVGLHTPIPTQEHMNPANDYSKQQVLVPFGSLTVDRIKANEPAEVRDGRKRKWQEDYSSKQYMKDKNKKLQQEYAQIGAQATVSDGVSPEDRMQSTLLKGKVIYVTGYTEPSADELKVLVLRHGGTWQHFFKKTICTHIIATSLSLAKSNKVRKDRVVTPSWLVDSIAANRLLPIATYQLFKTEGQSTLSFADPAAVKSKPKAKKKSKVKANLLAMGAQVVDPQEIGWVPKPKSKDRLDLFAELPEDGIEDADMKGGLDHVGSVIDRDQEGGRVCLPDTTACDSEILKSPQRRIDTRIPTQRDIQSFAGKSEGIQMMEGIQETPADGLGNDSAQLENTTASVGGDKAAIQMAESSVGSVRGIQKETKHTTPSDSRMIQNKVVLADAPTADQSAADDGLTTPTRKGNNISVPKPSRTPRGTPATTEKKSFKKTTIPSRNTPRNTPTTTEENTTKATATPTRRNMYRHKHAYPSLIGLDALSDKREAKSRRKEEKRQKGLQSTEHPAVGATTSSTAAHTSVSGMQAARVDTATNKNNADSTESPAIGDSNTLPQIDKYGRVLTGAFDQQYGGVMVDDMGVTYLYKLPHQTESGAKGPKDSSVHPTDVDISAENEAGDLATKSGSETGAIVRKVEQVQKGNGFKSTAKGSGTEPTAIPIGPVAVSNESDETGGSSPRSNDSDTVRQGVGVYSAEKQTQTNRSNIQGKATDLGSEGTRHVQANDVIRDKPGPCTANNGATPTQSFGPWGLFGGSKKQPSSDNENTTHMQTGTGDDPPTPVKLVNSKSGPQISTGVDSTSAANSRVDTNVNGESDKSDKSDSSKPGGHNHGPIKTVGSPAKSRPKTMTNAMLNKQTGTPSRWLMVPPRNLETHQKLTSIDNPGFVDQFFGQSRLSHLARTGAAAKNYVTSVIRAKPKSAEPEVRIPLEARVIMHLDMDSFFVSASLLSQPPHYKNLPVAVCHAKTAKSDSSSEIASVNYHARKFGVKSGMLLGKASRLCPKIITVPYDYEANERVSKIMYDTILNRTSRVEPVSIDELFFETADLLHARQLKRNGTSEVSGATKTSTTLVPMSEADTRALAIAFAEELRQEIYSQSGCTASVGIGNSKLMARLATRKAKPDGVCYLSVRTTPEVMREMAVEDIPGIGWSKRKQLNDIGVLTVEDMRHLDTSVLQEMFGTNLGIKLRDAANGVDREELRATKPRKTLATEISWGVRFTDQKGVDEFLDKLVHNICDRLRAECMLTGSITLKIKETIDANVPAHKYLGHGPCYDHNQTQRLGSVTDDFSILLCTCTQLFKEIDVKPTDVRGIGITLTRLVPVGEEGSAIATKAVVGGKGTMDQFFKRKSMVEKENNKQVVLSGEGTVSQVATDDSGQRPSTPVRDGGVQVSTVSDIVTHQTENGLLLTKVDGTAETNGEVESGKGSVDEGSASVDEDSEVRMVNEDDVGLVNTSRIVAMESDSSELYRASCDTGAESNGHAHVDGMGMEVTENPTLKDLDCRDVKGADGDEVKQLNDEVYNPANEEGSIDDSTANQNEKPCRAAIAVAYTGVDAPPPTDIPVSDQSMPDFDATESLGQKHTDEAVQQDRITDADVKVLAMHGIDPRTFMELDPHTRREVLEGLKEPVEPAPGVVAEVEAYKDENRDKNVTQKRVGTSIQVDPLGEKYVSVAGVDPSDETDIPDVVIIGNGSMRNGESSPQKPVVSGRGKSVFKVPTPVRKQLQSGGLACGRRGQTGPRAQVQVQLQDHHAPQDGIVDPNSTTTSIGATLAPPSPLRSHSLPREVTHHTGQQAQTSGMGARTSVHRSPEDALFADDISPSRWDSQVVRALPVEMQKELEHLRVRTRHELRPQLHLDGRSRGCNTSDGASSSGVATGVAQECSKDRAAESRVPTDNGTPLRTGSADMSRPNTRDSFRDNVGGEEAVGSTLGHSRPAGSVGNSEHPGANPETDAYIAGITAKGKLQVSAPTEHSKGKDSKYSSHRGDVNDANSEPLGTGGGGISGDLDQEDANENKQDSGHSGISQFLAAIPAELREDVQRQHRTHQTKSRHAPKVTMHGLGVTIPSKKKKNVPQGHSLYTMLNLMHQQTPVMRDKAPQINTSGSRANLEASQFNDRRSRLSEWVRTCSAPRARRHPTDTSSNTATYQNNSFEEYVRELAMMGRLDWTRRILRTARTSILNHRPTESDWRAWYNTLIEGIQRDVGENYTCTLDVDPL